MLQKVIGARDGGSDYFLAPRANCGDLTEAVPEDIEVFAVESFEEALTVVDGIAEGEIADLPRCE